MAKSNLAQEQADLQHLGRVRALNQEVAAAISAVEHNDLRQLQVAIANQERICNELVMTKWTPPPLTGKRASRTPATPAETGEQIQAAYVSLAQLNRVYAGVVKRSKRTVDLLTALYATLGAGCNQQPQSETSQILSCEV